MTSNQCRFGSYLFFLRLAAFFLVFLAVFRFFVAFLLFLAVRFFAFLAVFFLFFVAFLFFVVFLAFLAFLAFLRFFAMKVTSFIVACGLKKQSYVRHQFAKTFLASAIIQPPASNAKMILQKSERFYPNLHLSS